MKKAVFEALLMALVTCACSMHKSETAENADVLYCSLFRGQCGCPKVFESYAAKRWGIGCIVHRLVNIEDKA